jgi:hypothetical protein
LQRILGLDTVKAMTKLQIANTINPTIIAIIVPVIIGDITKVSYNKRGIEKYINRFNL